MLPEALKENPIAAAFENAGLLEGGHNRLNEVTLEIVPSRIQEALRQLKGQGFERLSTVTAVDRYPLEPRFEVIYQLQSVAKNLVIRLKCRIQGTDPVIDSATAVYASANWYEREVFDLFGIRFTGHPNLTRIMMPEHWEGHPLRRDYPVHGHKYSYSQE